MPYVKVKELLAMGKKNHACVLAFDAADVNMIKSVIKGAETAGRPVIVMLYPGMRNIMPFGVFAEVTRYYAERASVPVGLHLDHCSDFDMILEAIHEGFPSVMADGAVLPFEKNAAFTIKVVEAARNFDVDVEEMVQDKRGMATYGQIKEYVLEHSGLKVSSLYIAQVKQKHGIIERENYNKPKSDDARQPQCPLEKERAITEALKHFGML